MIKVPRVTGIKYNGGVFDGVLSGRRIGYLVALLGMAAVTALLAPFHEQINSTTTALTYLLAVLFIALFWGSGPALVASVVGVLCFNFFFLPPFYTLDVAHFENWIALFAFFTTALAVGQLSARAKRASQAEALKQSERLKSALLDAVTHDLRTPLTSIKASITTLLNETRAPEFALDNESRLEMLQIIDEESDRLNRFISGLIELARIDAGELQLRRQWGAIDEIVSTALARAQSLTPAHPVEVKLDAELPAVRVDERAVSEVVYTLVDNAAKYSPRGTKITISAGLADGMIKMAVEDQGEGVPAELRERVFEKFFRATRDGDVSTRGPSGTGMGLAIAKGIVEAHDGKIWIDSGTNGRGTRVVFTLPVGD